MSNNTKVLFPFPLRPDCIVSIEVPCDLNSQEATRLCKYIQSISTKEVQDKFIFDCKGKELTQKVYISFREATDEERKEMGFEPAHYYIMKGLAPPEVVCGNPTMFLKTVEKKWHELDEETQQKFIKGEKV